MLPFFLRPLLGQSTQVEPPADGELLLPQDLCFPAVRLAVKAEVAAPRDVLVWEVPEGLARLRLPGSRGPMAGAIERVVAHADTIPRTVTERVSGLPL